MKTIRLIILAVIAVAFLATLPHEALAGQELPVLAKTQTSIFGSFRTHKQGKGITAVWTLAVPDGVVGFTVERTYQDPTDPYSYWESVGAVPFNSTRSFSYTDTEVLPGDISYRITALMADGTTSTSDVSQMRIVSRK